MPDERLGCDVVVDAAANGLPNDLHRAELVKECGERQQLAMPLRDSDRLLAEVAEREQLAVTLWDDRTNASSNNY